LREAAPEQDFSQRAALRETKCISTVL
jgi:hypothetical protein